VLFRLGRFEEAKLHYQRSLAQKSDQPLVHKNLGDLLWRQGDLDAAIAQYHEALRVAPGFSGAQTNLRLALQARDSGPGADSSR
jgi:tetratricopeptide (TPR) repeat protein